MTITIDNASPESGWPPFMEWLKALKIEPGDVRRVTIFDDGAKHDGNPRAEFEFFAYDRSGERVVDRVRGEMCTYTRAGVVSPPPLHPERQAAE